MRSMLVVTLLLAGCGRTEPYGEPMQTATLCQAVMGDPLVDDIALWAPGGCLDVTFEPDAREQALGLHAALLEWAAAPGTWMCFNAPVEGPAPARGIHVRLGNVDVSIASVTYRGRELVSAEAELNPDVTFTHGMFLHTAGQLLGFNRTPQVDTVLNAWSTQDVKPMLTEADLQSVAAAYPACR